MHVTSYHIPAIAVCALVYYYVQQQLKLRLFTEATEETVVAPIESDLIQEASSLSRDEKHHHEGI